MGGNVFAKKFAYHDHGVMLLDRRGLGHGILELQDQLLDGPLLRNGFANDLLEIVLGRLMGLLFTEGNHLRKISGNENKKRRDEISQKTG